ncbi:MAG: MBL fold metallo-hydrolase, partial [Sphingomonadales bacterium]|nr:MBL fold metallo-hydrolase [Sphingomonadales bacterium]
MFTIGDATVDSALEMVLAQRPIAWLGASPEALAANRWWMAPHWLEPGDTWSLNFRTWIVRAGGKVIVVDPCTGNGRPNPLPMFDQLDVPFLERFEATGTRVEDVDHVFCTHLHHDHCGWNTMLRDGRWVPTFPRAKYAFLQREVDRWHPDNAAQWPVKDFNAGVFER